MTQSMWEDAELDDVELPLRTPQSRWTAANRWLLIVLCGIVLGAGFAWLIVPRVIDSAYRGESFGFINNILEHRDQHPVEFYQAKWSRLAAGALLLWSCLGVATLTYTRSWFAERVIGKATAGTLGAIRAVVLFILAYAASQEPLSTVVSLPASHRRSMGVMDAFYAMGYGQVLTSHASVAVFQTLTIVVLLLGAVGLFTRPVLVLGAILYLPLAGTFRSFTWFNHCGLVPWYCLVMLCFTRCGDGFSLDRLVRLWRNQPVARSDEPTRYYAWCRFAVWTMVVMPYVLAGMSKLGNGGWLWWKGENLQSILYTDALRPGLSNHNLIFELPWLTTGWFTFFGLVTIAQELGMFLVLFSRRIRLILPVLVALMHKGIDILMQIHFWDLVWIQLIFYDFSPLRRWIGGRLERARGNIVVLYDGACPMCQSCARVLGAIDLFGRLNLTDFRKADIAGFNSAHQTALTPAMIEKEMFAVSRTGASGGYFAWRKIAMAAPLLWPVGLLMWLPGVSQIGQWVYARVAASRFAPLKCDETCPLPAPSKPAEPVRFGPMRWAVACAVLPVLFIGLWGKRVEWFPLTSMQMFTPPYNDTGIATYYQVYMTSASGKTQVAYLELMGINTDRYVAILMDAFRTPVGKNKCVEMMQRCAAHWNRQKGADDQIVRMEAQKRQWDFMSHRDDPQRGGPIERLTIDISPDTSTVSGARLGN